MTDEHGNWVPSPKFVEEEWSPPGGWTHRHEDEPYVHVPKPAEEIYVPPSKPWRDW